MRLALAAALLTACVTNAYGDRVGDWRWSLSSERCEWIHRPGDRFRRVWDAAHAAAEGMETARLNQAEVCLLDPPVMLWGREVNGYALQTGGVATLHVRNDRGADVVERLMLHELLHKLSGDAGHAAPGWWRREPGSVERRATCALQRRLCDD